MTMSWLAPANEMRVANARMGTMAWAGSNWPIATIDPIISSCETSIQPLRRPRNGGTNRSIRGDQTNFQV